MRSKCFKTNEKSVYLSLRRQEKVETGKRSHLKSPGEGGGVGGEFGAHFRELEVRPRGVAASLRGGSD